MQSTNIAEFTINSKAYGVEIDHSRKQCAIAIKPISDADLQALYHGPFHFSTEERVFYVPVECPDSVHFVTDATGTQGIYWDPMYTVKPLQ